MECVLGDGYDCRHRHDSQQKRGGEPGEPIGNIESLPKERNKDDESEESVDDRGDTGEDLTDRLEYAAVL